MEELDNAPEILGEPTLSESDKLALCRAIIIYGKERPSEEDANRVFEWAHKTVINDAILALVLKGKLGIRIREDGELVFGALPNIQGN